MNQDNPEDMTVSGHHLNQNRIQEVKYHHSQKDSTSHVYTNCQIPLWSILLFICIPQLYYQ